MGKPLPDQAKQLLQKAQDNGSLQARKALQWLTSQNQDKNSFLEPVSIVKAAVPTGKSADLMYLDALKAWNRGDEDSSRLMLSQILNQYPNYTPAKNTNDQLGQVSKLGSWG